MGELRWKAYSAKWAGLAIVATILLAPRFAAAQVQYFVNVQPIQICPPGQDCAPIAEPGDNQIGFIDARGNNITRAILNQAGIDLNFLPLQQIRNGSPDITQPPNTLQLFPGMVPTQVSSPDFKALSDQDAISNGQPPSPVPPLASDPHTINLFFVPFLNPNGNLAGSTYFGVGWIGNNGAVVDQAIFGIKSPFFGIVGAVPDAIAHETVHVLGLDHPTDNTPQQINNLMSAVRNEPSIDGALAALAAGSADQLNTTQIANIINPGGGPLNSFLNPIPGVVTSITPADPVLVAQCIEFAACWTPGHPPTPWSHTLSSADLASLGLGTTEPLVAAQTSRSIIRLGATTITFDTTTGLVTESLPQFSGSAHNDPCNFCQIDTVGTFLIPANATDATISGAFGNSVVPNSAGVNVCLGAGPPCGPVLTNDFSVLFQDPGRPGESLTSLTLMAPAGFELVPSLFSQLELPGDTPGITASLLNPNCTISCTLVFLGNPFVLGDRLDYTIGVCAVEGEACVLDSDITALAGGRYGYLFSDGYMTTSVLALVNGALMASSRMPDLTTATTLDLSRFTPFSTRLPCAMLPGDTGCPPLVLPDDDTIENLIFFQAPEPPPVTIILVGLGLLLGLALQRRQAREARVIPRRYRLTPLFHSIPALRSPPRK